MQCAAIPSLNEATNSPASASPAALPEAGSDQEEATDVHYRGFGSFHSDNVQDLIELPEKQYVAPQIPEFARSLTTTGSAPFTFGSCKQHFRMDPKWLFINHGAFGGALRSAIQIKHSYEEMMEAQPLQFVDRQLLPLLVYSVRSLAGFLNAAPTDLSLVPNATFGLNAAIFGLIESSDVVAYLDSEYGSVWRMIAERVRRVGAAVHEIPVSKLLNDPAVLGSDAAITRYIEDHLPAGCTTFIVDHIASNGAFDLPIFTHIVPMLKRAGVRNIIVDGAHGPLQCPLDFKALTKQQRPSVYVGNLHKWFSCPKSVGFIWCHDSKTKEKVRTPIISHGFGSGFLSEFVWNGTTDYGAHLTIPAVIQFWNEIGIDNIRRYASQLLIKACHHLEAQFGVQPVGRHAPFMSLVRLPEVLQGGKFSPKYIQDKLHHEHSIEVPVKNIDGVLYLRLSCFVYNTFDEYVALGNAVEKLAPSRKREREGEAPEAVTRSPSQQHHTEGNGDSGCGVGGLAPRRQRVEMDSSSDDES
jgi:selenocysteine lyase/cysteine desulfurase